jgi:ABC-type multidrug transport system ATPase subunit
VKLEIERVLTVVELTGKINVKVKELSKGMQQRLSMAQALLGDPQLYILDEPMSGMDPPGRRLFRDLFCQLSKRGKTIFFSTHVLDDVETVCDDVIVLSKGELTFSGRIVDLLELGVLGTEMVISGLVTDDFPFLKNLGCTITESNNNTVQLFLSSNCDMPSIQSYLCSKNVIFNAVNKRSMSLEQLLYQKSKVESL